MTSTEARRLDYIDGLRLVGATAVVVQHLFERFSQNWAKALVEPGPGVFGVVLFFMISGFVIPFSVGSNLDVRAFAIRRLARVYPAYLLALALAVIFGLSDVAAYFHTIVEARPWEWLANLLLVQDFVGARPFYSVSWTLAIEFIWYGVFVCLVKFSGARAGPVSAVGAPAMIVLMTLASLALGARIPLGRPAMIYAAVLGYQAFRFHKGQISLRAWRLNVITFLGVTLASNYVAFGYFHHPKISLMQAIGPWTAALAVFVCAIRFKSIQGTHGLANPAVAWLGAASYSIYMMHPLAIAVAVHLGTPILVIPAAITLTLALAVASYWLVERPGIQLGRSLSTDRTGISMPAPATS